MRFPHLLLYSFSSLSISAVLSGCGATMTMSPGTSAPGTGPAPTVVAVGEQVNGVAPNRKQEVQFSEAMDSSTINAQSFQVTDSSGKLMQGSVSYDPNFETASFLPSPALQTNATYTATVTTAAASVGGMHLASPYSYTFNTRTDSDTSPLTVNSVTPAANATCVSPTMPITITFNEAPDASSVNSTNIAVTGQSLYAGVGCNQNYGIASFSVDSSTGNLSFLGDDILGYRVSLDIAVLGNDSYAYSALGDCMYGSISSFARSSSGLLTGFLTVRNPTEGPPAPPGATSGLIRPGYSAEFTATDSTNHVVMAEIPCFSLAGTTPQIQLATYTADANGNLSTSDTYATMPATPIIKGPFGELKISPSNTLLAVGGYGGLQVFHFNGANPITSYTGLLATEQINDIAWDNNNHLYAITSDLYASNTPVTNPNKLYVFTVTDTTVTPAPGSPYTIAFPFSLAVQPNQ